VQFPDAVARVGLITDVARARIQGFVKMASGQLCHGRKQIRIQESRFNHQVGHAGNSRKQLHDMVLHPIGARISQFV
jgi:hypothetical protein